MGLPGASVSGPPVRVLSELHAGGCCWDQGRCFREEGTGLILPTQQQGGWEQRGSAPLSLGEGRPHSLGAAPE